MIGIIESTSKSQSGKTLGVKIGGKYYTTKNWELADLTGKEIVFEPEPSEFNGKTMYWLNDYSVSGTQPTPSAAAMDQAVAVAASAGERSHADDKDALIGAMALTKACPGSREEVWETFQFFYFKLKSWDRIPF